MKKIVVTGATSMIGAALVREAIKEGIFVLCLVRKDSGKLNNIPKSDLVKIEFCNIDEYSHLVSDKCYDIFYHLAWEKTTNAFSDDIDIQLRSIQYAIDAARLAKNMGCKKFIGTGSQAEYGPVTVPLKPETPVNPENGYGIAKYTAGKLTRLLCSQLDLQFNWVRIVSIFGPFDRENSLIMYTIHELQAGRSPELTKCEQVWDYLYCDDTARALLAIGKNGIDGKTYILGSGEQKKLSEYLEIIKNIVAPNVILGFGKKEYYSHQFMYLCADISDLINDTRWKPEVSFEDGIKETIKSFCHNTL
jgi:nucleoside-diphosphate-sugar epimerase